MTENVVMLRAARRDDLPAIQQLERAAGAAFRDLGMSAVADDEPPSITDLASFQEDGRAWVITDNADRPVAYLLIDVVDGMPMSSRSPCTPNMPGGVWGGRFWTPPLRGLSSATSLP